MNRDDYNHDYLMQGKVRLRQSDNVFRASLDAILLAAAAPFGERVADIGAGAGAVALCYSVWHPQTYMEALELQPQAYALLCENIRLNHQEHRMRALHGDLFSTDMARESYDVVLSNPPYLPFHSPKPHKSTRSLAIAEQNWRLDDWVSRCFKLVKRAGWVAMIHRSDRLYDVLRALHGKTDRLYIYPLFSKAEGVSHRFIFCARKKSSRSVNRSIPPPIWWRGMVIHRANGDYTEAAAAILDGEKKISMIVGESVNHGDYE